MGWENLQEELQEEFDGFAYAPEETLHWAFVRSRHYGVPTGYTLRNPKPPQNLRAEGRAKVNVCQECAKPIPQERKAHAKFCTTRCKNRSNQKQWLKNHPEWRKPSRARSPQPNYTHCWHCGEPLPKQTNGLRDRKRYCDKKCQGKYHYAHGNREKRLARARRWRAKQKQNPEIERKAA